MFDDFNLLPALVMSSLGLKDRESISPKVMYGVHTRIILAVHSHGQRLGLYFCILLCEVMVFTVEPGLLALVPRVQTQEKTCTDTGEDRQQQHSISALAPSSPPNRQQLE